MCDIHQLVFVMYSDLSPLSPRWEHLVYQFGCHDNIIKYVIKDGKMIVRR